MKTNKTTLAVMIASCFGSSLAMADEETKVLSPVVVTATRVEQDSFDLPMSIDKIENEQIQDAQARVSLAESLSRIPGVTAQFRNIISSDLQISSRGFGSRSTFGVRGIRLYVDGIPLTMSDGIGNPGNVDLGAIGGIEVMRGPFSAMYGSSSGGVIQLFTQTPPNSPEVGADFYAGSFGTHRAELRASGTEGNLNYLITSSDYSTDGFRKQSASDRQAATVRLGLNISEDTKLTSLINWFQHNAQDPGGLTSSANASATSPSAFSGTYYDWTGATTGSIKYNAHSEKSNTQIGFKIEKTINSNNKLNLITFAGNRTSDGYISTGTSTSGRLSQIDRDFYGFDLQGINQGTIEARPYAVTYGISSSYMSDHRLDSTQTYSSGVYSLTLLKRNEIQKANNFDQYIQGMYSFADRWDLHAGVRHSNVSMDIKDRIGANNGNLDFSSTLPVAGLVFKASPTLNFYANAGKGFEAPNLIEISYNGATTSTMTGANTSLKASSSTNLELGSKWIVSDQTRINAAVFDISTKNEIVIADSSDYTVYTNAGKTHRTGAEISVEHAISSDFRLYAAYTLLDAKYEDGTVIRRVPMGGKRIPGTYATQIYAEAAWKYRPIGFNSALEARYFSKVYTNDALNPESAPSFTLVNFRSSFQQISGKWQFTEYARIENIFDQRYIGSVKVNDTNFRYYEPAPGRNYIVGVKANYVF